MQSELKKEPEDLRCVVCLEEGFALFADPCKHLICEKCFHKWTKIIKKYECPMCKQNISHTFLPPIFPDINDLPLEFRKAHSEILKAPPNWLLIRFSIGKKEFEYLDERGNSRIMYARPMMDYRPFDEFVDLRFD